MTNKQLWRVDELSIGITDVHGSLLMTVFTPSFENPTQNRISISTIGEDSKLGRVSDELADDATTLQRITAFARSFRGLEGGYYE